MLHGTDSCCSALPSVQGGVVMKKREWKQASRPWLLAVEDPQQLGRDIGSATFNILNVQHLFAAAAATLRDCAEQRTEDQQWASVQVCLSNPCWCVCVHSWREVRTVTLRLCCTAPPPCNSWRQSLSDCAVPPLPHAVPGENIPVDLQTSWGQATGSDMCILPDKL